MNGSKEEMRQRLSLLNTLDEGQAVLILAGTLGILDSKLGFNSYAGYTQSEVAQEIINDIDTMIAKSIEKGLYS